ncbi:peptidase P60 [Shewanella maritima]|uniref:Peptidase P60 n=1 Tax=Shewanella maritima TaxID=2520507 RepID=A0A411PHL6_9GAMM|nr:NlpC/P60 family protein [Shewanella maritima]QBF83111.1 peptidase P60 [Shewanella maritima]
MCSFARVLNVIVVAVLLTLTACSSAPPPQSTPSSQTSKVTQANWNEARIRAFYQQWQGVPYRLGGMDKRGTDCSGLVVLAYQSLVGGSIPRTTEQQTSLGYKVAKSELQAGDLVFFKTSWRGRHVGIYLSNRQFLHVSSSRGVMISSLDNVYWQPRYWFASRLVN